MTPAVRSARVAVIRYWLIADFLDPDEAERIHSAMTLTPPSLRLPAVAAALHITGCLHRPCLDRAAHIAGRTPAARELLELVDAAKFAGQITERGVA